MSYMQLISNKYTQPDGSDGLLPYLTSIMKLISNKYVVHTNQMVLQQFKSHIPLIWQQGHLTRWFRWFIAIPHEFLKAHKQQVHRTHQPDGLATIHEPHTAHLATRTPKLDGWDGLLP